MIINFQNCSKNVQRGKSVVFRYGTMLFAFQKKGNEQPVACSDPYCFIWNSFGCIKTKIEWVSSWKHKHFKCSLQYSIGIVYFTFQHTTHKLWINRRNWIAIYRPNCLYYCYIQLDPEMYIISLWNWVPFCKENENEKMLAV